MEKEWFGTSYSCSKKKKKKERKETEPGPHTGYKSVPTDWYLKCERQNYKTKKIMWVNSLDFREERLLYVRLKICILVEKEMATHSSILAWETPWTEEPSGL